jgi:hypothetical protein
VYACAADSLHDGEAIEPRQHAINDHQVVGLAAGEEQAILAVGRTVDDVALLLQPAAHVLGSLGIVFNNQDLHVSAP